VECGGRRIVGSPALLDEGDSVSLALVDTELESANATRRGLRRLFRLSVPEQMKYLARNLPGLTEMALRYAVLLEEQGVRGDKASVLDRLREELIAASSDRAFFVDPEQVRNRKEFEARAAKAKTRLTEVANELCRLTAQILVDYQQLRAKLNEPRFGAYTRALADVRMQLKELLPQGFLVSVPFERLRNYPRYLEAIGMRLDKLASNPERDAHWQQQLARLWQTYTARTEQDRLRGVRDDKVQEFRWMLEELRVSLWAQQLKTPYPVSFKRLEKYWAER
jgi:ATP-dependent helicase HrpA